MSGWGDLISDVRTHFDPNSTDYHVLRSLLVLDNKELIVGLIVSNIDFLQYHS